MLVRMPDKHHRASVCQVLPPMLPAPRAGRPAPPPPRGRTGQIHAGQHQSAQPWHLPPGCASNWSAYRPYRRRRIGSNPHHAEYDWPAVRHRHRPRRYAADGALKSSRAPQAQWQSARQALQPPAAILWRSPKALPRHPPQSQPWVRPAALVLPLQSLPYPALGDASACGRQKDQQGVPKPCHSRSPRPAIRTDQDAPGGAVVPRMWQTPGATRAADRLHPQHPSAISSRVRKAARDPRPDRHCGADAPALSAPSWQ